MQKITPKTSDTANACERAGQAKVGGINALFSKTKTMSDILESAWKSVFGLGAIEKYI